MPRLDSNLLGSRKHPASASLVNVFTGVCYHAWFNKRGLREVKSTSVDTTVR